MTNLYELSDEELANLDVESMESVNEEVNAEPEEETNVDEQVEQDTETPEEENQVTDYTEEQVTDEHDTGDKEEESSGDEPNVSEETKPEITQENQADYRGFYDTLTKPFKANGREFHITDPNDMIALMQKGLNYSKKMEELKPNLNLIKTLEKYGLTNESELSYLIDLYTKNPDAIARLIKESEIDLYELDTGRAEGYVPLNKVVHKSALEEIIAEVIDENPNFNGILDTIYTDWDTSSKQVIIDNPALLKVLNNQQKDGTYDRIMAVIDYEKAVGRLQGVPFLQAYSQIEERLRGNVQQVNQAQPQPQVQSQSFTAPRPTQASQNNIAEQKRRVASPSTNTAKADVNAIDPLKMSDEELIAYMESLNQM